VHSILARDNKVDLIVNFAASHIGSPFRQTQASKAKANIKLQFSFTFNEVGQVNNLVSLGNDERLARALGFHYSDANYGGCFCSSFGTGANEIKQLPNARMEIMYRRGGPGGLARSILQAGWKWSTDVKPRAKTDFCTHAHFGFVQTGKLNIRLSNGDTAILKAGDAFYVPPGHDAWADEQTVLFDQIGLPMEALMPLTVKSFSAPDERKELPLAKIDVVKFGELSIMRLVCQSGWRWSTHVKPTVGGEFCQHAHFGVVLAGSTGVRQASTGSVGEFSPVQPGEAVMFECEPGHDGWVNGQQPVEMYDIAPMARHYGGKKQ